MASVRSTSVDGRGESNNSPAGSLNQAYYAHHLPKEPSADSNSLNDAYWRHFKNAGPQPRTEKELHSGLWGQSPPRERKPSVTWAAMHGIKFSDREATNGSDQTLHRRHADSLEEAELSGRNSPRPPKGKKRNVSNKDLLQQYLPPIFKWLPNYDRNKSLRVDIIAGLVIAFMVIPQGMAYGMLAGMPVEYGLYSSMMPPLIYAIFGGAAHLSLGTNAPISILVADSVTAAIPTDTDCSDDPDSADCARILDATLLLCLMSGLLYLMFMIFRFSIITSFVPDPVLSGFTTGASVIIITSNMKHVFGISTKRGQIWEVWASIFEELPNINWAAFVIFSLSFMALLSIKELNRKYKEKMPVPIPEQLFVLIICTVIVAATDMDVPKVKDIPSGLKTPELMSFDDFGALIQPAIVCSIVTYILTFNVAKACGDLYGYEVDGDQEFVANCIAAVMGSFTGSYLPSGSFSRSALVGEITGDDGTPLHNIISVTVVALVVMFLTPLLYHMPKAIMASIIYVALKNMMNFGTAKKLYSVSKQEWGLWMISFVSTSLLGVTYGIGLSILASILLLVKMQAKPATRILGVLGGAEGLNDKYGCVVLDVKNFDAAMEIEGIKIFKFEADLHFANKDHFEEKLKKMQSRSQWNRLHTVIIDCSSINTIDLTCVKMLERLHKNLKLKNTKMLFANWKAQSMRRVLDGSGFYETIGEENFFLKMRGALDMAIDRGKWEKGNEGALEQFRQHNSRHNTWSGTSSKETYPSIPSFENLNIFYVEEKGQEMQGFLRGVREEGEDRV
mmetsp:Transcript_18188/g.37090  ORF Transcript_18188/g.37090 Transcript_18188/m.37090 type:complete len:790 (-) Transcript_18188:41-2410(-)|eukprot:CAMPEP_0197562690 /NCGR_PEP_ID=MMETSP1320-20131121/27337_1 /TAXON_ID=91990 /ORGANISM="Bolidomonas sp., Strain RCC2347" /LENGTH=789 /DNA_ID=CAMNT_0043124441 /DNA_START=132 /DNA_END=2501 /DNA_ORIENTATION=-